MCRSDNSVPHEPGNLARFGEVFGFHGLACSGDIIIINIIGITRRVVDHIHITGESFECLLNVDNKEETTY